MTSNQEQGVQKKKTRQTTLFESVLLSVAAAFLFLAAAFLKNKFFPGSYVDIDMIGGAFFVFFTSLIIFLILIPRVKDLKKN
ncbi:hypothetical protein MsAg5_17070 [Methanosarcinaceae archaeon Ag5]|uniref:Uncharacterized protein n=1 Tax=Methanolapillus africanus TaxID=3028297 RepID=A0AAE4MLD6_9EURY|nr:hypothetical protein [Methanosarcinaceae archaeon Ag5]